MPQNDDAMLWSESDSHAMRLALALAQNAQQHGEVPVGAVVTDLSGVVGQGYNQPIGRCDPTAHAEIEALRQASRHLNTYRLPQCTLYVTLEPCLMCAGAILHARLKRVVYATVDPKTGAVGSVFHAFSDRKLPTVVVGGLFKNEASALLQTFFQSRRVAQRYH